MGGVGWKRGLNGGRVEEGFGWGAAGAKLLAQQLVLLVTHYGGGCKEGVLGAFGGRARWNAIGAGLGVWVVMLLQIAPFVHNPCSQISRDG